jgi:hypothetical protein
MKFVVQSACWLISPEPGQDKSMASSKQWSTTDRCRYGHAKNMVVLLPFHNRHRAGSRNAVPTPDGADASVK